MKIGVLRGTFKLVLSHHVDLIQKCSSIVDKLFVFIDSDDWIRHQYRKVILSEKDRCFILKNIKGVDDCMIFINEEDFARQIQTIKQTFSDVDTKFFYFKGGDYRPAIKDIPEIITMKSLGFLTLSVEKSEETLLGCEFLSTSHICDRIVKSYQEQED